MAGKHVRSDFSTDRISKLPCNVIECILTRLPLREAVRTSVLSTHWRHNWLTIPHLVFDQNFSASLPKKCDLEYTIYHILLTHKGPVVKFLLDSNKTIKNHAVDHWLHILSNHPRVETLTLNLWNRGPCHFIPQYMFSCHHLMRLSLKNVKVQLPTTFKGFSRLVSLDLDNVHDVHEVLKTFISKCPMLEHLHIDNRKDTMPFCLDISAPNLKSFHFYGIFNSICFETESLEEIQMGYYKFNVLVREGLFDDFEMNDSCGSKNNVVKFFSQVPSIKRADLYSCFFQFLAASGVPRKLPDNLHHLTHLKIHGLCLEWIDELKIALCLIRSSPSLQVLEISLDAYGRRKRTAIYYLKAQQECEYPLSCSIKAVKIEDFEGDVPKMEFVKLLLLGATALEKLEIKSRSGAKKISSEDIHKMVTEVTCFPRASPKAVVIFDQLQ